MKKSLKISIVLLALSLLLSALAVTAFASEGTRDPFIVNGEGFDGTLQEAVNAAGENGAVVINSDITLSEAVSISANATVDLEEHSLSSTSSVLFQVADGVSFGLCGKGDITVPSTVIACGTDSEIAISGDIAIKLTAHGSRSTASGPDVYTYATVFDLGACKKATVTGKLTVTPEGHNTCVFTLGNDKTSKSSASVLEISNADITVNVPWNNAYKLENEPGTVFALLKKGSNTSVTDSQIDIQHGNVFRSDIPAKVWGVQPNANSLGAKSATQWLSVKSCDISATEGGYTRFYQYGCTASSRYDYYGNILNTGNNKGWSSDINASFEDCNLYSNGTAFQHNFAGQTYSSYSIANLKNVNLYYVNGATHRNQMAAIYGHSNITWDGGIIDYFKKASYSQKTSITISDSDPFGDAAKEAIKAKGLTLSSKWYVSTESASSGYTYTYYQRSDVASNVLAYGTWSHFTNGGRDYGILIRDVYMTASISGASAEKTMPSTRSTENNVIVKNESAVIIWRDANGNVLGIDKYTPQENLTPEAFDGELPEIEGITPKEDAWTAKSENAWDKNIQDIDLSKQGFTIVTQASGASVPKGGVPGIKINISTYSDHRLNFYIPVYNRPDTVSGVNMTISGGAALGRLENVTIGGLEYEYYYIILGAAETEIIKFNLNYTSGNFALSQEINYGIPTYAVQVMESPVGTGNINEEAKTLVVNMANYADKVLSVMGADKTTDGARLYSYILNTYGEGSSYGYLNIYKALTDDRFSESGDIYSNSISGLTYKNSKYIESASFFFSLDEPAFAIKYNKDATKFSFENKEGVNTQYGIVAPNANGDVKWISGVVSTIRYHNDPNNSTSLLAKHVAYEKNADGSNGALCTNADIYGANSNYDSYNYWALSLSRNPHTNEYHSLFSISKPITIVTYKYYSKSDTGANDTTYDTQTVTYGLAAYIKDMIDSNNTEFASAAKALYAYSKAADLFQNKMDVSALGTPVASAQAEKLPSETELVAINNNVYTNKALYAYMEFDKLEEGDEIYVGHAILPKLNDEGDYVDGAYASSYAVITSSYIQLINYYSETNNNIGVTTSNPLANSDKYYHGLTISDKLEISIVVEYGLATVTMTTSDGSFIKTGVQWNGRQGNVLVKPVGLELSNVKLNWYCDALSENVWVFGASYLNYRDKSRWPYYMKADGYTDNCLIGYPGMGSKQALKDLKLFVEDYGYRPKYIAWTVGMNVADKAEEAAPNSVYLADTQEFIRICKEYGITPVLCTIPNTPTVINIYKNEWIRNSGERYIDFAAAVGSDVYDESLIGKETGVEGASKLNSTGYTWTEGYISKDLVHPKPAGAVAMYEEVLRAFPEIKGVD